MNKINLHAHNSTEHLFLVATQGLKIYNICWSCREKQAHENLEGPSAVCAWKLMPVHVLVKCLGRQRWWQMLPVSSPLPYGRLVLSSLVYSREYQGAYSLDSQCCFSKGSLQPRCHGASSGCLQKIHSNLFTVVHTFFPLAQNLLAHQPLHLTNGVSCSPAADSSKKE